MNEPKDFCFPNGESILDVQKRAQVTLFEILEKHQNSLQNIGVVTHMITIKVLTLLLLNIDLNLIWEPQYTIPNTGMVVFEVETINKDEKYTFKRILTESSTPHLV
jgi:broad specificity phosphatase PhoE